MIDDEALDKVKTANANVNRAKSMLNNYFSILFQEAGIPYTQENTNEVNLIVESIMLASRLMAEVVQDR